MKLLKNPVTKTGDIRYFEVFKIFLFVLFLFALYTKQITLITGFNTLSYIMFVIVSSLVYANGIYSIYKETMVLLNYVYKGVKCAINKLYAYVRIIDFTSENLCKIIESNKMTFSKKSVYCVFRC